MPASKITYADQVDNTGATEDGRWTSDNADEVKAVVNEHADQLDTISSDLGAHGALSLKDSIDDAALLADDVVSEDKLDSATRVKLNSGADTGALLARANHTGTQTASTISDLDNAVSANADVAANKIKLAGTASGATQNSSDAQLRDRSSHTGTQDLSTISDSGILAGLDSVETEHIEDGSVTVDKLAHEYTVNVANKTLAAAVDPARYTFVQVAGSAGGLYEKTSADISALVTLDTTKAVAIAYSGTPSGSAGGWVRPLESSLNIRWFGAVGDGTTDDSPAFQAAIDLIPDSRLIGNADGTVSINIPALTAEYGIARYRIETQLVIPDRAAPSFESDGAIGATLVNATGTDYIITDSNTSSGARRIFKGLSFHQGGILIPDRARGLVLIERCAFYQTPVYAVHLQNDDAGLGPVNVKVYDCIFNECVGGVNVDASTYLLYHIRGCRFMEQHGSSIEINGPGGTIEDCDFQGMKNATDTHIWFRGAPANSADNNATSWRVRDCRFGNEVYNKLGTDYDVPGSAITLGEAGQTPVVGVIIIEGNHFRGRASGGTATNGTHLLRCYQKPSAVKVINNNVSYAGFHAAAVRQDWIADLNALTHDDLIVENEFSGNDRLNRMDPKVYYPFDNGDGVITENGIGWSFDPRTWKESAIILERADRLSCSADHGIVGGEDNLKICLKVGLPTARPLVDNALFGASSGRNYLFVNPDGILRCQIRTTSPSVLQYDAPIALPLIPSRLPFLIMLDWDGTTGDMDFYYSFSDKFDDAEWISLGSDTSSATTLSTINDGTQFFIGYKSSVVSTANEGEGDFYALQATIGGSKVLDWRAAIQREVQATNFDAISGEKWTADTALKYLDRDSFPGLPKTALPKLSAFSVDTIAEIKAETSREFAKVILTDSLRHGLFEWDDSDLSAEVTADPLEGIYVAPDSDATGAFGAWVRVVDEHNVRQWGVQGNGLDETAGIQAALDAMPIGQTLRFSAGNFVVTAGLVQTRQFSVIGSSQNDSLIRLDVDVSDVTSDAYTVHIHTEENKSRGDARGMVIQDLKINTRQSVSHGGRHALVMDATGGHDALVDGTPLHRNTIRNCNLRGNEKVNGRGVRLLEQHAVFNLIESCQIGGGIALDGTADGNTIRQNTIYNSDSTLPAITVDLVFGAYKTSIENNALVCSHGAVLITNGSQVDILNNQIEQPGGTTNDSVTAKNAHVVVEGATYPSTSIMISGNNFGAGTNIERSIYLDDCSGVKVVDNDFNAAGTEDIYITANGKYNIIGHNNYRGTGRVKDVYPADITDLGVGTYGVVKSMDSHSNSWVGGDFVKHESGHVEILTPLSAGTTAANTVMCELPAGFHPNGFYELAAACSAGAAHIRARSNTGELWVGDTPSNAGLGVGVRFLAEGDDI